MKNVPEGWKAYMKPEGERAPRDPHSPRYHDAGCARLLDAMGDQARRDRKRRRAYVDAVSWAVLVAACLALGWAWGEGIR